MRRLLTDNGLGSAQTPGTLSERENPASRRGLVSWAGPGRRRNGLRWRSVVSPLEPGSAPLEMSRFVSSPSARGRSLAVTVAVFVVAWGASELCGKGVSTVLASDSRFYFSTFSNLLRPTPGAIPARTFFYPATAALVHSAGGSARELMVLQGLARAVACAAVAWQLGRSRPHTALAMGLLLAADPVAASMTSAYLTESLYSTALLLSLAILIGQLQAPTVTRSSRPRDRRRPLRVRDPLPPERHGPDPAGCRRVLGRDQVSRGNRLGRRRHHPRRPARRRLQLPQVRRIRPNRERLLHRLPALHPASLRPRERARLGGHSRPAVSVRPGRRVPGGGAGDRECHDQRQVPPVPRRPPPRRTALRFQPVPAAYREAIRRHPFVFVERMLLEGLVFLGTPVSAYVAELAALGDDRTLAQVCAAAARTPGFPPTSSPSPVRLHRSNRESDTSWKPGGSARACFTSRTW